MEASALERLAALPPGMLACPDTSKPLRIEDGRIVCPESGREFPLQDGIPSLLPAGFEFSAELEEEDRWYREQPTRFPPAHDLARQPIREAFERLGIGGESWVLNVGAGAGTRDLRIVERYTERIVCLDISREAVRRFLEKEPYSAFLATAEQLPFADDSFDVVLLSGILHHVAGHSRMLPYLKECRRVLKPGGALVALDPNLLYPIAAAMAAIDLVAQRVRPGWRHHVPHERPLVPASLRRSIRAAGFAGVELIGTSYVHNRLPWPLARFLGTRALGLARRPFFRHFGYWIGCMGRKAA